MKLGRPTLKNHTKTVYLQIAIPEDLKSKFMSNCEKKKINPSALLRNLIKEYVEN